MYWYLWSKACYLITPRYLLITWLSLKDQAWQRPLISWPNQNRYYSTSSWAAQNGRFDHLIISNFTAWLLDLTSIPVAGVSTAGIYVTTPCVSNQVNNRDHTPNPATLIIFQSSESIGVKAQLYIYIVYAKGFYLDHASALVSCCIARNLFGGSSRTQVWIQLSGRGHDRKPWTIINSRQKHGRKHPWLGSAAYLSIIYLEYLKISPEKRVYRVNVNKSRPQIRATLD